MAWGAVALAGLWACGPQLRPQGLEVISVVPRGPAAQAGLLPGDRLISLSWPSSAAASQPLTHCLDLLQAEVEFGPRGGVTVAIERRGERREWTLPAASDWGLEVAAGSDGSAASRACRAIAAVGAAWNRNQLAEADRLYDEAATAASELGNPLYVAYVRQRQGKLRLVMERFDAAREALMQGLALRQAAAPESLSLAASWQALGELESRQGRLVESDRAFSAALALRAKLAPESREHAWSWGGLGVNAYWRQDFERAVDCYGRASALLSRVAPESVDLARMETNLGLLARERGDLAVAVTHLEAARDVFQRLDPKSQDLATSVLNLALVAMDHGDLAQAEDLHQQALHLFEGLSPESLGVAQIYENLGVIARDRNDLAQAEVFLRRSLALRQKLGASPREEARSLSPLAFVVFHQGRAAEARPIAERVLALSAKRMGHEGSADETPQASSSLQTLAELTADGGDVAAGVALMERAMVWKRKVNPGSLQVAVGLEVLGDLLSRAGRREAADAAFAESIALLERLAPDSYRLANVWGTRGRHLERAGRADEAAAAYRAAILALEAQISRLGGGQDARASFLRQHGRPYQRLMALELARGNTWAALETLERSRGRDLLAQLLSRRLGVGEEVPADLASELRQAEVSFDRVQGQLGTTEERSLPEVRARLLTELAVLRSRRAVLHERVAHASPRYASLLKPSPPDLAALRRRLAVGTVWLSYSVLDDESFVFITRSAAEEPDRYRAVRVARLGVGRAELAARVAMFRGLILAGREAPTEVAAVQAMGRELYALLVAPAAPELATAKEVTVSADGPLHLLPFAALVATPSGRYWSEDQALLFALSGTVAAELAEGRGQVGGPGDPLSGGGFAFVAPATPSPSGLVASSRSALERYRAGLAPLPGARAEARALSELFGAEVEIAVGRQAQESAVKALSGRVGFVHFACHALLDVESPLDSALALAEPAADSNGDNGLLQAWEIFDQVRLDTPLVTLSACETGLGRDGGGEGLVGLARAFQHAGARAVLATLWEVSDRASADLIARFYQGWAAGRPPQVALAEAQRAALSGGGTAAHPFYWAGFTLSGSPR